MRREPVVTDRVWTVPNALSILRLLLVPVFAVLILTERDAAAIVVLMVSGFTDYADGKLARRFSQVSQLQERASEAGTGARCGMVGDAALPADANSCSVAHCKRQGGSLIQKHGRLARLVLDQVEKCRLRPVDVIEDDDEGTIARGMFE